MPVDQSGVRDALATRSENKPGTTIKQLLEKQSQQIRRALPTGFSPDRFTRIVLTECKKTPRLLECTTSSLLGAVMYAAQLGVEPGPLGHAYLVPYRNRKQGTMEVQFILGYKGMIDLARRSGEIRSIVAREVYPNDEFEVEYGLEERLVHKPSLENRGGDPIAYYGVAKFKDGGHQILVMSRDQIDERRARSKAKDAGPWVTDYPAMARKTLIRAMQPYLPLTVEVATAVEQDENIHNFDAAADDPEEAITIREVEVREIDEGVADPAPAAPSPEPANAAPSPESEEGGVVDAESTVSEPSVAEGDGPVDEAPLTPVSGNPVEYAQLLIGDLYDQTGPAATARKRGLETLLKRLGVEPEKELTEEQSVAVIEWLEGETG